MTFASLWIAVVVLVLAIISLNKAIADKERREKQEKRGAEPKNSAEVAEDEVNSSVEVTETESENDSVPELSNVLSMQDWAAYDTPAYLRRKAMRAA